MDKTADTPETLVDAVRYFASPDVCLNFLAGMRWPDGVTCPACGSRDVSFLKNQRRWKCREVHERRQFSVKVGTIFEDSPIGLDSWLPAVWMIVNDKNGISSYEVARALGVTQKSAWFMMHRIRLAMQRGEVEAGETLIGGKARFMHAHKRQDHRHGRQGQVPVTGLSESHGPEGHPRVRVKHAANQKKKTLTTEVRENVAPGANLYTDALASYEGLSGMTRCGQPLSFRLSAPQETRGSQ